MSGLWDSVKNTAPGAYKAGLLTKNWLRERTTDRAGASAVARQIEAGTPLTVDIGFRVGMGGLLTWAGRALHVGQVQGVDLALRFSSPTYAPTDQPDDWLDRYFERRGSSTVGRPVVAASSLPLPPEPAVEVLGPLVWGALALRPEIEELAGTATPRGRFAAVHYRGSDKYLEAPRVDPGLVLDRLAQEMERDGVGRLFVASDTQSFVDLALSRFGSDALFLDCVATADGNVAAHHAQVPGETKAAEALATMLVLSRADLLVRTESLLSQWSTTLPGSRRTVLLTPDTLAT